ncbi:MAG: translational GTPase TypA [Clostridia bacterium]|jgi:GTP-binding protein|nr:translational GTPase TypA [Clostridia bacterium]
MQTQEKIRNIAIVAHVDHGKTTLVDQMLRQSGIFSAHEKVKERVMDSGDLEQERGITILSKNTAVEYNGVKINIVDTPGHADFGGEVERVLTMVDSVLLLVDAFEGCMPQTRFVLKKALALGKHVMAVVNKIDRPGARPEEVVDSIIDLFIELDASEDQLDFPIVYTSAKNGTASLDAHNQTENIIPLFDAIMEHAPAPKGEIDGMLQVLISNIDYDEYIGRIGIGRVERGSATRNMQAVLCKDDGTTQNVKIAKLFTFSGLDRVDAEQVQFGDIIAIAGIPGINIGETVCDPECVEPLPFVKIDEPTVSMNFMINNSPFVGTEGKYVTSRNIRERLMRELETNVSLRVEETDSTDSFKVSGRGELHLSILIETMRREDFEFAVSRPRVIYKEEKGVRQEPYELLMIDIPGEYTGVVVEKINVRKGELVDMATEGGSTRLEFKIPARGLIGYRNEFMTDTKGNGILNHIFCGYRDYAGDIPERQRGSIMAHERGESTAYGLFNAQERGRLFVGAGVSVYEGMIVGENARLEDIIINVCKKKQLTNTRASGSDESLRLTPATVLSLEQSLEFIADDELVEVTPQSIRLRKAVLNKTERLRSNK